MRALLAQLAPEPGALDENTARVLEVVRSRPDVGLAVFPELFLGGYDPRAAAAHGQSSDDDRLAAIAAVATETQTGVMVGFAERSGDRLYNALGCFDTGGGMSVYRKTHLFAGAEQAAFVAGDELLLFPTAGPTASPLICFDVEFPEAARAAASAGAELLVTAAANFDPLGPDHELAVRARSLDNRISHVYVNRVGSEAGLVFAGGSMVVGPDGQPTAVAGRDEELLVAEVPASQSPSADLDYLRYVRGRLPVRRAHANEPVEVTA